MKYYAIIVAGGSGNRMQNSIAKQFLLLNGKPVLMHTLEAFYNCTLRPALILVLNIDQHSYWEQLCKQFNFNIVHEVIEGGEQRYHSVKNGLKAIKGRGLVAVHDAVRPLVTSELIESSYRIAEESGNAIAGISPTDSIRKIDNDKTSVSIPRESIVLIQTPQTFRTEILRKSYQKPFRNDFTDDASVVEHAGYSINIIIGERTNIKITYPEDMEIATLFLNKKGF
jgi:2-C-methyl-D-erythritol 4-phosphate cytidylyltransferase